MSNFSESQASRFPATAGELVTLGNNVRDAVARAEEEVRQLNRQRFLTLRAQVREALVAGAPLAGYQYLDEPVEVTSSDAAEWIRLEFRHEFGDGAAHRFANTVSISLRPRGVSFDTRVDWLELPEPRPYYKGLAGEGFEKRNDESLQHGLEWIMSSAYRQIRETARLYGLPEDDMLPKQSCA